QSKPVPILGDDAIDEVNLAWSALLHILQHARFLRPVDGIDITKEFHRMVPSCLVIKLQFIEVLSGDDDLECNTLALRNAEKLIRHMGSTTHRLLIIDDVTECAAQCCGHSAQRTVHEELGPPDSHQVGV